MKIATNEMILLSNNSVDSRGSERGIDALGLTINQSFRILGDEYQKGHDTIFSPFVYIELFPNKEFPRIHYLWSAYLLKIFSQGVIYI